MGLLSPPLFHRFLMFFAVLLAAGMPLSVFLQSVGAIGLIATALLGAGYKTILNRLKENKLLWPPVAIYLIHLIGLIWSSDLDYALHDLRVKLPLLSIPVALAAWSVSKKNLHVLLLIFLSATLASTLVAYGVYKNWIPTKKEISDIRHISILVSHVRLCIFIVFSILIAGYLTYVYKKWRWAVVPIVGWFLFFLYLIQSPTGFIMLIAVLFVLVISYISLLPSFLHKVTALIFVIMLPVAGIFYVSLCVKQYYTVQEPQLYLSPLSHTAQGNAYQHQIDNKQLENGYYVWYYLNYGEVISAWSKRSPIPFDSLDLKGQPIMGTLFRYTTSKGLHKDYEGIMALSDQDIKNIESGSTSAENKFGIRKRINEIIFELDMYKNGGNPSGNSVTQRFEFWKNAFLVIGENLWVGVGTGDTRAEMKAMYVKSESVLKEDYHLGAHNQFITFLLGFGVIGFPILTAFLLLPFFSCEARSSLPHLAFLLLVLFSFLSEDTLETQAGVTFFAFFSSLFAVVRREHNPS